MLAKWLPWVSVVVALAAVFTSANRAETAGGKLGASAHRAGGLCVVLAALCVLAGFLWKDSLQGIQPASVGAMGGLLLAALAGFLGSRFDPNHRNLAAPIAWGIALVSFSLLTDAPGRYSYLLGAAFGTAAGAWILDLAPTPWPGTAAISAAAAGCATIMGSFGYGDRGHLAAILIGLAFVALSIIVRMALPPKQDRPSTAAPIVLAVAAAIAAWLIAAKYVFLMDAAWCAALGFGSALVVAWLLPKEEESSSAFPAALSIVIWLAAATIAFGLRRGYGMSICLASAVLLLSALGNGRALLSTAPLAAFVLFRVMKELHPESARAVDIGQHYGAMGLFAGIAVVLLILEWRRSQDASPTLPFAGFFWVAAAALLPAVATIVLGSRGFPGFLLGIAFGPAIALLRGESSIRILPFAVGIGTLGVLQYGWLSEKLDLTRALKLQSLIGFAIALAVLAAAIAWLSRKPSESVPAPASS